jgi:hypothetical protein
MLVDGKEGATLQDAELEVILTSETKTWNQRTTIRDEDKFKKVLCNRSHLSNR